MTDYRHTEKDLLDELSRLDPRQADGRTEDDYLVYVLNKAIEQSRVVTLVYYSDASAEISMRDVYPMHTKYWARKGVWTLEAYCCKAAAMRNFRIDRIRCAIINLDCFNRAAIKERR